MKQLILASQSPRRKMLLEQVGIPFSVIPSDTKEDIDKKVSPEEYVRIVSLKKAMDIAEKISDKDFACPVILAADTIVVIDGKILGKPETFDEAYSMLSMLSGNWHEVITGVTVIDTEDGIKQSHVEKTRVKIRSLDHENMLRYINSGEPFDKAGGYGVQALGALLVERIEGDYFNVVGLPLYKVSIMLKNAGIKTLLDGDTGKSELK
ncbi:MAG: septum formation inhibitor Maf [Clostridiaceae bacterium]|jgi:septum formation protein|nr:septum formation inhibitor Maf [Clostridiaceae bacterium]